MLAAAFWCAMATGMLLIGMALAYGSMVSPRWTGLILAFGVGAIIGATVYQLVLTPLAEEQGSYYRVGLGLAAGALSSIWPTDRWIISVAQTARISMGKNKRIRDWHSTRFTVGQRARIVGTWPLTRALTSGFLRLHLRRRHGQYPPEIGPHGGHAEQRLITRQDHTTMAGCLSVAHSK